VLGDYDDRPGELFTSALVRARMCEVLAEQTGVDPDSAFTVGLFSIADALLGVPMHEIVERLPFTDETRAALAFQTGPLGHLLYATLAYEQGMLNPMEVGLSVDTCQDAYIGALNWSREITAPEPKPAVA
jgi:EAL and modified HD-GYP domain-containing signal transduction protein